MRKAGKNAAHLRITLDHLGCPARETKETAQSVSGVQCTLFAPPLWPEIRPQ
ncbi:DUF6420 family protein [Streptomyces canus]|uniref:DUF6420 family protein n=1 Tax=Streptomyces canus TaxID=58343 RepID=UPI0033F7D879